MILALLWSCTPTVTTIDLDGDGAVQGVDCTDVDPRRTPGNPEHCDGVDEDCDGATDEDAVDAPSWYADDDGDGYGDDGNYIVSCLALEGRVELAGDCDDGDIGVAPNQLERCDGVDEDCDGAVDDTPIDGVPVYVDADGDGYGADEGALACDGVTLGGDCDDASADAFPGAPELCDGVDTDCDGALDVNATDGQWWWPDADGDGYGDPGGAPFLDCAPTVGAPNRFDCDDSDAARHPPVACGPQGVVATGHADVVLLGTAEGQALSGSLEMADIDGDDVLDLLVGAPGGGEGSMYMYADLRGSETLNDALARRDGDAAESLGSAAGAADIDGDGDIDLFAGAPTDASTFTRAGAVWIFPGPLSGRADIDEGYGIYGETVNDQLGSSVAWVGDTTGDGLGDLAIGAPFSTVEAAYNGRVYIVPGPITGTLDLSLEAEWAWFDGAGTYHKAGADVAGGDLDGDGVAEVLVGAPGGYRAHVLPGGVVGAIDDDDIPMIGNRGGLLSVGTSVDVVSDLNGDGYGDVLMGCPPLDSGLAAEGEAYVFTGPIVADLDLPEDGWFVLEGEARTDGSGESVRAGDVDGDGDLELVTSAPDADHGGTQSGSVYVYHGLRAGTFSMADADTRIDGHADDLFLGGTLAVGDLDGDGAAEIAIGTVHEDAGGESAGGVYLFWGGE